MLCDVAVSAMPTAGFRIEHICYKTRFLHQDFLSDLVKSAQRFRFETRIMIEQSWAFRNLDWTRLTAPKSGLGRRSYGVRDESLVGLSWKSDSDVCVGNTGKQFWVLLVQHACAAWLNSDFG
jgi:hypothetical protein